jgi:hypothetical protein
MDYDTSNITKVMSVYQIKNNKNDTICPAVKIEKDHDGSAVWVAALLYNIYSRYLESIPDNNQLEFQKDVQDILTIAFETGMECLETLEDFKED